MKLVQQNEWNLRYFKRKSILTQLDKSNWRIHSHSPILLIFRQAISILTLKANRNTQNIILAHLTREISRFTDRRGKENKESSQFSEESLLPFHLTKIWLRIIYKDGARGKEVKVNRTIRLGGLAHSKDVKVVLEM